MKYEKLQEQKQVTSDGESTICRHSEVEIEENPGGDEYRESPDEFTPDLKFVVCKNCGEIV